MTWSRSLTTSSPDSKPKGCSEPVDASVSATVTAVLLAEYFGRLAVEIERLTFPDWSSADIAAVPMLEGIFADAGSEFQPARGTGWSGQSFTNGRQLLRISCLKADDRHGVSQV